MPIKIDANASDIPMGINDIDENTGETNNNDIPIDHCDSELDQIHIPPGSPKDSSMLSRNSRLSTSHSRSSIIVTPDKVHPRKNVSNIFSKETRTVPP